MKLEHKFKSTFVRKLIDWYQKNKRDLPWRHTSDPYKIWVAEVMLQQTQVDQVVPYYERFIKKFPDAHALAAAELSEVLKVWEGMGYYSRARNLQNAAQIIVRDYHGKLPATHDELIKIPGIGPYTAAAVASIAFNEDYPVVDGNVLRVLARILKIQEYPRKNGIKARFVQAARDLLPSGQASDFNQGLMELGAVVCTPRKPKCTECPITFFCQAYQTLDDPSILPVKSPQKAKPHYTVVVGIIWKDGKILIDQRPKNGLLGGLWEFPGGKQEAGESLEACLVREIDEELGIQVRVRERFKEVQHAYSHFRITLHAFQCDYLSGEPNPRKAIDWTWAAPEELPQYPFPRANKRILDALLQTL